MTDQLKDLIQKIHDEGVKAAQEEARQIEAEAQQKAASTIEKAKAESARLIAGAKEKDARLQESTKQLLAQASRDMLLALKKEISAMLNRIIAHHVSQALEPPQLGKIITSLIKDYEKKDKADIVINLKKDDLDKLQKGFLGELKQQIKKGVTLKASDDISGGFTISYDAGKSHYDFTDKALSQFIASCIKPRLADILKEGRR
jgi:V/A-type H+-transporting ATPase subunit E